MRKNYIREFLFWFHLIIILSSFILSWVLPLLYVLVGLVLHFLHITIFDGCIITRLQKRYDKSIRGGTFYEFLIKKVFAKKPSPNQILAVNVTHVVIILSLALIKFVINL